jgi:RHS repeat-associated protein
MSNYGFSIPTGGYDGEDRLVSFNRTSGLTQSWNLTAVGDWSSVTTSSSTQTRTHGPTHELLTGGGSNVSTDTKGNITLIPSSLRPTDSGLSSVWDFDNRLVSATTGSTTVTHQYDALGRRVSHTIGSTTTIFVQAGQQTIADYTAGATPASSTYRYVYASYIDEPVMRWQTSNSTPVYYHRNQQYSVTALTDSTGAVLERYAYSAYGVPTIANASGTVLTSSAHNNRYLYTGREWDNDIQQYHYRARMYDASLGRFCSRDPIGYEGGPSVYLYVLGRVLDFVDPSGLRSELGGDISNWPNWGDPPNVRHPLTPSWTSWFYNITDNYAQYAAYHCFNQCSCSALQKLIHNVDPLALGIDGGQIATDWIVSPGEFDDGVLDPDDFVMMEDGTYRLAGRAHSALRHCITSGFIASALKNCTCAACIADARDMYHYHWEIQSPTSTRQAFYNNRERRLCAGCIGKYADSSGVYLPDDDGDPYTPAPFAPVTFASKDEVVSCCKNKLKRGRLATTTNAPVGGPGYPILPPRQWPSLPQNVPPNFNWPGIIPPPPARRG